jgi:hypothetical protein
VPFVPATYSLPLCVTDRRVLFGLSTTKETFVECSFVAFATVTVASPDSVSALS